MSDQGTMTGPRPMNVQQVAHYLNCSKRRVYELIEARELRAFKIGAKYGLRVHKAEVDRWVGEQEERLEKELRSAKVTDNGLPTGATLALVKGAG